MFILEQKYSVSKILGFTQVNSSTWYSHMKKKSEDQRKNNKGRPIPGYTTSKDGVIFLDSAVVEILRKYRAQTEFYNAAGYHKLTHYLRRDYGISINHKKLYRLCTEHKLLLPKNKKKRRRSGKVCINREITAPNQLWEFDIKYGYVHGENRFFFILSFLDVFTRLIASYHIGRRCTAKDLIFTLKDALRKAGLKEDNNLVIRSDNGTQMTSHQFQKYLSNLEISIEHEFIPPMTPNKNTYVESFHSILETEFFQVNYFDTYNQAYKATVDFMNFYNNKRIHGSLKFKTPAEILKNYQSGLIVEVKHVVV